MKNNQEISEIKEEVKLISNKLDNHLHDVLVQITTIKTDLDWVKRTYWIIAGATLTALVGAFVALVLK